VIIFSLIFVLTVGVNAKSLKDFCRTYLDYRNHWQNGQVFAFTFNQSDLKSDGGIYYILETEHTTIELNKKEYAILEPKQEYTLYYFSYKGSCRSLSITPVK
jgi:hypothetical protein